MSWSLNHLSFLYLQHIAKKITIWKDQFLKEMCQSGKYFDLSLLREKERILLFPSQRNIRRWGRHVPDIDWAEVQPSWTKGPGMISMHAPSG